MAKRKFQRALYVDEDDTVKKQKLVIETSIIHDDKNGRSWHLLDRFLVDFPQLGYTMAVLSPRTEIPLSPFNKLTPKEQAKVRDISAIAQENLERRDKNVAQDNKRNRNGRLLEIALLIVGGTFVLIMLLRGCSMSTINIGFPGM
jgi:hypothetical protein